jgi:hypothetical protein
MALFYPIAKLLQRLECRLVYALQQSRREAEILTGGSQVSRKGKKVCSGMNMLGNAAVKLTLWHEELVTNRQH